MNKKRFLIIIAAALSIVGVLNINIKTVSAAETSTVPATTIAETPVPTAGVTKAVSEIDFSAPAVEPAPEPVEPTYSINGYDGLSQTRYCILIQQWVWLTSLHIILVANRTIIITGRPANHLTALDL